MENFKKRLYCFFHGHRPSRTRGFYDEPAVDSVCLDCGKELNPWRGEGFCV